MNSTLERIIRRGYSVAGRIYDAVTLSNLKVVAVKSLSIEYGDDEVYRMLASLGSRKGNRIGRAIAKCYGETHDPVILLEITDFKSRLGGSAEEGLRLTARIRSSAGSGPRPYSGASAHRPTIRTSG